MNSPMIRKPSGHRWDKPSTLKKVLRSGVLDRIRGQNFTAYSDADLRDAYRGLVLQGQLPSAAEILPMAYGLLAEAIDRRLGAWRIFGARLNEATLERCQAIATQILSSGEYATRINMYIDDGFLESAGFANSLTVSMAGMNLDRDEQTIIKTLIYVAEKGATRHRPEILLPAEFYRALARKDPRGVASLHVTDEQILSGIMLYQGNVVELNSGEGKTIAAAFPAALHSISGRSVHVITANDYLAARDCQLLEPVYQSLGLTVDVVLSYMSDEERRDAYTKQVVYGTLREFGFDFLRDNLKMSPDDLVQGKLGVAIVDEVDHALIDEASTPMIIGGTPTGTGRTHARVRNSVRDLVNRQNVVTLGLAEQLDGVGRNSPDHHILLAKLMLGQPDHPSLKQHLAENPVQYRRAQRLADREQADYPNSALTTGLLYIIDPQNRYVTLTEAGQELLEARLGNFFDAGSLEQSISSVTKDSNLHLAERRKASAKLTRQLLQRYSLGNQVYQMLRAYLLLKKDTDYLVTEDAVVLIDRCTGRPRPDSRYQQGLQAALEAKEGVTVHPDSEVLAQISVQGYVSQYWMVSGMTGTALTSRDEFHEMYGLDVQVVPPTQPSMRVDSGYRVYAARDHKLAAVVDEVEACLRVGRPVLIATLTIEQSEEVSHLLTGRGVPHNLLNAVSCHDEARIVREAGNFGAVTVATNMAGRGTDIVLQPNLSGLVAGRYRGLVQQLLSEGSSCVTLNCYTKGEADILWDELSIGSPFSMTREHEGNLERIRVTPDPAPQGDRNPITLDFGLGLYVMGIELSQSARIDLQLKGRSGRQGEFGLTRFFLSLEDQFFGRGAAGVVCPPRGRERDPAGRDFFEGADVARLLKEAQGIIEGETEALRRYIRDYGGVLDAHTLLYYRARREVMASPSFRDEPLRMARHNARYVVHHYFPEEMVADYGLKFDQMAEVLQEDYGIDCSGLRGWDRDSLIESIGDLLVTRLEEAESRFGGEGFGELAKPLFLRTSDELWTDHFSHLQELMSSIQHGFHYHQAALSEYVLQAFKEQRAFRQHLIGSFLSRLVRFPTASVPAQPTVKGHMLEGDLAHDVALVLV